MPCGSVSLNPGYTIPVYRSSIGVVVVVAVLTHSFVTSTNRNSIMSDDDDCVAVLGVTQTATITPSVTIDLCDDDDMAWNTNHTEPRRKKRRPSAQSTHLTTNTMPSDFVRSVDRNGVFNEDDDKEMRYRRALGPVRMAFVPSAESGDWSDTSAPHAFGKERARTAKTHRTLFNELLEYQLNLPINWSSSIFCRVAEARSDLLRVLITGAFGWILDSSAYLRSLNASLIFFCKHHILLQGPKELLTPTAVFSLIYFYTTTRNSLRTSSSSLQAMARSASIPIFTIVARFVSVYWEPGKVPDGFRAKAPFCKCWSAFRVSSWCLIPISMNPDSKAVELLPEDKRKVTNTTPIFGVLRYSMPFWILSNVPPRLFRIATERNTATCTRNFPKS
jgi:hypothetical protein